MQSLCTLRSPCHQWLRNTRYQADATPYSGRTSTGWIAPALRLAHLFDYLVSAREQRGRHGEVQQSCGPEINRQFKFGCLLDGKVTRLSTMQYSIDELRATHKSPPSILAIAEEEAVLCPRHRWANGWDPMPHSEF